MTYLGIDYGSKKIGLAIGNNSERLAMPLRTIENNAVSTRSGAVVIGMFIEHSSAIATIKLIAEDASIGEIVVGVPVSFDGKEHAQAKEARAFGESLKSYLGIPVNFENEILTSKQSKASGAGDVDASSAALILQSFLDRKLKE